MSGRQLGLPLGSPAHFAAADFLPGDCNAAALAWLDCGDAWPEGRLALWGDAGTGKSHALHGWAERAGAVVLSGPALRDIPAPPGRACAIDDADLATDPTALLHMVNGLREARLPLLLAGRAAPAHWPASLPDLASRLRATTAVRFEAADDGLLRALLARLFRQRQLTVAEPVQAYLLVRLPRDCGALREAAARLDHASLAAGRGIDRALAAGVAGEIEAEREAAFMQ